MMIYVFSVLITQRLRMRRAGLSNLFVNPKILKCVLNARYTALDASKEHVDRENRS